MGFSHRFLGPSSGSWSSRVDFLQHAQLVSLVCCVLFAPFSISDPRATQVALICTNRTAPEAERTPFVANFIASLDAVTPLVSARRFAGVVNGSGNATVFTFGECMKDLSQLDCDQCFAQCKTQILRCLPFQRLIRGGRLFYDGCYLRYDDYDFFKEAVSPVDRTVCSNWTVAGNVTVFWESVVGLMTNLSRHAPKNDGFLVGNFTGSGTNLTVYGLAQCWERVTGAACNTCLTQAVANISSCAPKEEGRILRAGCYMRYSTKKFYDNSTSVPAAGNGGGGRSRLATILAATSASAAFLLIVAAGLFVARKKQLKRQRERKQLGSLLATVNKSKLNFSYETLEKATNYFSNANKLGQGGSGSVYKGTLPDGKVVAIKRLFFNTRQWVDHFFNEVNLISDINHKNLVRLLGCSIAGPESLLVYEYVPNQSLQDHMFGNRKNVPLSWAVRCNIILGTAQGLAYLHEEMSSRIIHRDIKLSNVLLDEDCSAKIADFGLARLFPEDRTHISTAIAGTLGYMAPEYIVRGKLTEKADVYSFGVLVAEVVCGRKNSAFTQNSYSMLQMVLFLVAYSLAAVCLINCFLRPNTDSIFFSL
uniref:Cysteine-rich receptor-like protein kinase 3 n=1 Tax=Kalanchoe fedtschenkoi TaxID=63787 RepID=A0A7N0T5M2_KALFE